jgi:hypothetical protein
LAPEFNEGLLATLNPVTKPEIKRTAKYPLFLTELETIKTKRKLNMYKAKDYIPASLRIITLHQ